MSSKRSSIPRLEVRRDSETSIASVSSTRNSVQEPPPRASQILASSLPQPSHVPTSSKPSRLPTSPRHSGIGHLTPPSSRSESEDSSTSSKNSGNRTARPRKSQLLTPSTGAFRSNVTKSKTGLPQTPTAPRPVAAAKRTSANITGVLPLPTPGSPYLNAHCSDSCTIGSLVHCLSPCGHKVITKTPEPCASNCQRAFKQEVSRFANTSRTEARLVCATCVDIHILSHYESEVKSWRSRFEETEKRMGGFASGWFESQIKYSERVLENDIRKERDEFEKLGRPCYRIPGAPLELPERQPLEKTGPGRAPVPWPPNTRPKAPRLSNAGITDLLFFGESPKDVELDC